MEKRRVLRIDCPNSTSHPDKIPFYKQNWFWYLLVIPAITYVALKINVEPNPQNNKAEIIASQIDRINLPIIADNLKLEQFSLRACLEEQYGADLEKLNWRSCGVDIKVVTDNQVVRYSYSSIDEALTYFKHELKQSDTVTIFFITELDKSTFLERLREIPNFKVQDP